MNIGRSWLVMSVPCVGLAPMGGEPRPAPTVRAVCHGISPHSTKVSLCDNSTK